jgi:hypothetical protein
MQLGRLKFLGLAAMCNDYANDIPRSIYVEAFSELKLPVVFPKAPLNLEPRDDIWPTDVAPA